MQKVGLLLVGVGTLTIIGYFLYYLLKYLFSLESIPLPIRAAIPAVAAGIVVLLVAVAWDAYKRSKTERFEEVDE